MGKTIKPSIRIYTNKIENRITFKFKARYYLKFLTPETMKLLGSTKSKLTKGKKWLKCSLFINYRNNVLILHCNIFNNSYQKNSRVLYTFVPNKSFGQLN